MVSDTISLFLEKRTPAILAGACFAACAIFKSGIVESFIANNLSLPQLYTAIFGWASIMTGFLFGVYSLIVSKSDGFIFNAMHTRPMKQFLSYAIQATTMGFILTIFGMGLLVSNIEMKDINNLMFFCGSLYFSLFVYSFLATVRVAYILSIIINVRTRVQLPA